MARALLQVVRGFLMGSADVVPGVSGGTVALVLGIYRDLVGTIATGARALGRAVRLDLRGALRHLREVDWGFLLPLLTGVVIAIVVLAHAISVLLEEQPVRIAAVFFGLVAGSIVLVWRMMPLHDGARLALLGAVAVAMFFALGLRGAPVESPALPLVFGAGMIAICAMILPGISGAFLLLMMGMYDPVIGAVNERDVATIAVFVVGAVIGLALFSNLLGWLLEHHEATVMAALVGLLVGSLRVLWPWPEGTAGTRLGAPAGDVFVPAVLALLGAGVVLALGSFGRRRLEHP